MPRFYCITQLRTLRNIVLVFWMILIGTCFQLPAQRKLPTPTNLIVLKNTPQTKTVVRPRSKSTTVKPRSYQHTEKPALSVSRLSIPDTVTYGVPFVVHFHMEATNWKNIHSDSSSVFDLIQQNYFKQELKSGYVAFDMNMTWIAYETGYCNFPPMKMIISGKEETIPAKQVFVLPHNRCELERKRGKDFFIKTYDKDVHLKVETQGKDFTIFNAYTDTAFVIVANHKYWDKITEPVLAFSPNEYFCVNGKDTASSFIVENLSNLLKSIDKSSSNPFNPQDLKIVPHTNYCAPLLGRNRWGQHVPFNQYCPRIDNEKNAPTGCTPLAIAQLLSYWQQLDTLPATTYTDTIARLIHQLGVTMNSHYGTRQTSTFSNQTKPVMCNHFGMSSHLLSINKFSEEMALSLIFKELNKQHPCLVCNESHMFVCDGYKNGYLHYNFGWEGLCNGYYLPLLNSPLTTGNRLMFSSLFVQIFPENNNYLKQSVTLTKNTTLADLLTVDELSNITHLVVNGIVTGKDVVVLRKMAGAVDDTYLDSEWEGGNLTYLDLSNAKFVTSKDYYKIIPAMDKWYFSSSITYNGRTSYNSGTFDLCEITTIRQWKEFSLQIGTRFSWFVYTFDGKTCYKQYCTSNKTISPEMFMECSSLKKVQLPINLTKIGCGAFAACYMLQEIVIPDKLRMVERQAFSGCISLEKINFPQRTKWQFPNFEYVSTGLTTLPTLHSNNVSSYAIDIFSNAF